jgi:site-specific recombinase XerD
VLAYCVAIDLAAQLSDRSVAAAVEAYLAEVRQRSGSARTPTEYRRYLARFFDLVGDPRAASAAHVHTFAYASGPTGRQPTPGTVNMRLSAVRGFYGFLQRMGIVASNPAAEVRRPRLNPSVPRGLSASEVRRLLAALPKSPAGVRDRAIILAAVLTGLRRSELLNLRACDLTRDGRIYYRVRTKGGRERHRELPAPAFAAILDGLAAEGRKLDTMAANEKLFNISAHGFYLALARHGRKARLARVTPHVLRHSAAKLRRDTGATIEDVQALLGHSSLATTARYLQRLEGAEDAGWRAVADALGV